MPAAIAIPAAIGAAGSIGSALVTSHAANKAADQQQQSGEQALNLQRDIYNSQVANLAPFRNAGVAGVNALPGFLGLSSQNLGTIGQGLTGAINGIMGGHGSAQGVTGQSANYNLPMGAISDPSKNGGFAGQVPGTTTLGSTSYQPNPQAPGYGPQSSPIPNMRFQRSDGQVYTIPASEVPNAQRQDPSGKVLGPA